MGTTSSRPTSLERRERGAVHGYAARLELLSETTTTRELLWCGAVMTAKANQSSDEERSSRSTCIFSSLKTGLIMVGIQDGLCELRTISDPKLNDAKSLSLRQAPSSGFPFHSLAPWRRAKLRDADHESSGSS
jgi:hypothetical protein